MGLAAGRNILESMNGTIDLFDNSFAHAVMHCLIDVQNHYTVHVAGHVIFSVDTLNSER